MSNQILHGQQTQMCTTCNLQPLPQSSQYLPFIVLQIILAFINIKFSLIILCLGYAFSKTIWICPLCKRDIPISKQAQNTNDHIIIRIGDCMMLISKNKFRIVAVAVIALIVYFYTEEPVHKPKVPIQKTWKSIVTNCGYQAHLQNSVRTNFLYSQFSNLGLWEIQSIFLSRDNPGKNGDVFMKVKMNPSQFQDPNMEDFRVFIKKPEMQLEAGDQIRLSGQWSGRIKHYMIFSATKIQKTGRMIDPASVQTFSKSIRRAGKSTD